VSRRVTQKYRCPPLAALIRQLLFAPNERRVAQLARTEALHDQIEPNIDYPYEFLSYRITGYRSETEYAALLKGSDILPDLRLMIDELSWSAEHPLDSDEPCESADDLAVRLNVSTKTLSRWRKLGLRWRWQQRQPNAAKELVYPQSAVRRFLERHDDRAHRAADFTQINDENRRAILDQARALAAEGGLSFNQVAQRLADEHGRAVETVRQLIEKHDRRHANDAIFPQRTGPIREEQQGEIIAAYCDGTRTTLYRIINNARSAELRSIDVTAVTSPTFVRDDAASVILRPDTDKPPAHAPVADDDLPEPLATYAAQPLHDGARITRLFVRMNFLKYRAATALSAIADEHANAGQLDHIEADIAHALELWREVVLMHRPVLVDAARHHNVSEADHAARRLQVLIEVGQPILIEAARVFDPGRNQTFETYLRWRLMRHFATLSETSRASRRVSPDEWLAEMDAALPAMPVLISRRRKDHAATRRHNRSRSPRTQT
jgi:hypothetical protein